MVMYIRYVREETSIRVENLDFLGMKKNKNV